MADVSNPWETLAASRNQHATLASFAKDTAATCKTTHDKQHIIQCPECYPRLIAATRVRYLESPSQEWFSNRPAFLRELNALLSSTTYPPTLHPSPNSSEPRDPLQAASNLISRERGAYIRTALAKSVAVKNFAASADGAMSEAEFRARTEDRTSDPRALLTDLLGAAVRRKEIRSRDVERQVEKLEDAVARGDEEAKLGVLMDVLFSHCADVEAVSEGMENGKAVAPDTKDAQAALARLRAGQPLEAVLRQALRDREAESVGGSRKREKEQRTNRLLELRRGKAAEERKKELREREKAGGGRGGSQERGGLPEAFYDVSCLKCARPVASGEGEGVTCCDICFLEAGRGLRSAPTYFCSKDCADAEFVSLLVFSSRLRCLFRNASYQLDTGQAPRVSWPLRRSSLRLYLRGKSRGTADLERRRGLQGLPQPKFTRG